MKPPDRSIAKWTLLGLCAITLAVCYSWWRTRPSQEVEPAEVATARESVGVLKVVSPGVVRSDVVSPARSLDPPTISEGGDRERLTRFIVRGREDPLPEAFIAMAADASGEFARIDMRQQQKGTVQWDVGEGPPMVLIGAPEHFPEFLDKDDERWGLPEVEIVLEPATRLEIVVLDLVTKDAIAGARVRFLGRHPRHLAGAEAPLSWTLAAPAEVLSDKSGRVSIMIDEAERRPIVRVTCLGYWPLREQPLTGSSPATLELAPLLAGGVLVDTGRPELRAREFGMLAVTQIGPSPVAISGPPLEDVEALRALLHKATGLPEGNVLFSFASLRPKDQEPISFPLTTTFEYQLRLHATPHKGSFGYFPVRELRKEHLTRIDVSAGTAELGLLEIEFEGVRDHDSAPRDGWRIIAADGSPYRGVPRGPDFSSGSCRYSLWLGPGEYLVTPGIGFVNTANFAPAQVKMLSGTPQRLVIPKASRRPGELHVRVQGPNHVLDQRPSKLSIRQEDGGSGVQVVALEGEARWTMAEGQYTLQFFVPEGASEPMSIEILPGETTAVVYPPNSDSEEPRRP